MIGGPYFRAGLLALCALGSPVHAATTTGTATATTLRPLSVVKTDDLEFGSLVPSALAGTATINPVTDARTTSGGTTGVSGALPMAAHFTAAGVFNAIALISLPGSITLTRVSGTETMTVTAISSNGPTLRLFPATPTIDIAVGGTLGVGANQVPGNYTGTFTVNVFYF
jgi:Domain of unknown function (DUF4402)